MTLLTDRQLNAHLNAQYNAQQDSPASTSNPNSLTSYSGASAEAIYKLLPHRYPFALVDRIIAYRPGEQAVGLKNVTINEPFFQGHFPNQPIMPGVLIVEAIAQVGGFLAAQMPDLIPGLFMFAGLDKVRFRHPVRPGDQLIMTATLLWVKQKRFGKMSAQAEVGGHIAVEGEMMFSIVDMS